MMARLAAFTASMRATVRRVTEIPAAAASRQSRVTPNAIPRLIVRLNAAMSLTSSPEIKWPPSGKVVTKARSSGRCFAVGRQSGGENSIQPSPARAAAGQSFRFPAIGT